MKILAWTLGGTAVAVACIYLMVSIVGPAGSTMFSAFFLPIIYILGAWVAALVLQLEGWATLVHWSEVLSPRN